MSSIPQAYRKALTKAKQLTAGALIGVLAFTGAACSQQDTDPYDHALLWRIEKDGIAPSYVLGTMHSDDPRVMKLAPQVTEAFDQCHSFAMEVKLDDQAATRLQQASLYQDGSRLSQHLPPTLYQQLVVAAGKLDVPPQVLDRMRPWAISMLLSLPKPSAQDGQFLDLMLMNRARNHGQQVLALENIEEQIDVLSGFTPEEELSLLADTLKDFDGVADAQQRMLEAYLKHDLKRLVRLSQHEMGVVDSKGLSKKFWKRLVTDRNQRMATRMLPMLLEGRACVAIGALHLAGKDGVLARISQQGYKAVPVF